MSAGYDRAALGTLLVLAMLSAQPGPQLRYGPRSTSRYRPHQGSAEKARRQRQMRRDGILPET